MQEDSELVKVESINKTIVEPVWTLEDDFDGKVYAEYIVEHPEYDGVYVRSEVLKKLEEVANSLDDKYRLVLRAGHRPAEVQKKLLELCTKDYKGESPEVSDEDALSYARTFVDDPSLTLPLLGYAITGSIDIAELIFS